MNPHTGEFNAADVMLVAGAVFALVQFIKWSGLPTQWGHVQLAPVICALVGAVGVAIWRFDHPGPVPIFQLFAGWITVTTSAAGAFGFMKAGQATVESVKAARTGESGTGTFRIGGT